MHGMSPSDQEIMDAIEGLLRQRKPAATICPSEVARALAPDHWRPLMPRVRAVAMASAQAGTLQILQGGRPLDPKQAPRGPIRLGHPRQRGRGTPAD